MNKDGAYKPDRIIRDVYEAGTDEYHFAEMGLSPYSRVGSLAGKVSSKRSVYRKWIKPQINTHPFTYVGPLIGPSLSPYDRQIELAQPFKIRPLNEMPVLVIAAISLVSTIARTAYSPVQGRRRLAFGQGLTLAYKDRIADKVFPVMLFGIAVLLVIYASILTPVSVPQPSGNGGNGNPYSNTYNGQVIYSTMFPLLPEHGSKPSINIAKAVASMGIKPSTINPIINNGANVSNYNKVGNSCKNISPITYSSGAAKVVNSVTGGVKSLTEPALNVIGSAQPSNMATNPIKPSTTTLISVTGTAKRVGIPVTTASSTGASLVTKIEPVIKTATTSITTSLPTNSPVKAIVNKITSATKPIASAITNNQIAQSISSKVATIPPASSPVASVIPKVSKTVTNTIASTIASAIPSTATTTNNLALTTTDVPNKVPKTVATTTGDISKTIATPVSSSLAASTPETVSSTDAAVNPLVSIPAEASQATTSQAIPTSTTPAPASTIAASKNVTSPAATVPANPATTPSGNSLSPVANTVKNTLSPSTSNSKSLIP